MKITIILIFLFCPLIAKQPSEKSEPVFKEIRVKNQEFKSSKINYVNYFPLQTGDFWEYIESEGLLSSQTKEVLGDTLLSNGKTYKKVYTQYCANSVAPMPNIELLRKDSIGNIYTFFDDKDHLLYDFSKNVGDTISSPWQGYYWGISKKYQVIAFGEDTVKAIDMYLNDSLNQQSYFITFIEKYGITFYSGERNRQAGDYVSAKYWGSIIDGFQRKELLVTKSAPDWKVYYPLEVGDKWIYEETNYSHLQSILVLEVVKDTLFEDGFIYKKVHRTVTWTGNTEPAEDFFLYERLDSTGKVFRIVPFDGDYNGRPVLQFSMCVGDTIALYRNVDEYRMLRNKLNYFWDILDVHEFTLFYSDPYSLASEDQFFVKNIGLIKKDTEGIFDSLIGAYIDGNVYGDTTVTSLTEKRSLPQKLTLYQNYPNPFNPTTIISFFLPYKEKVILKIYDISGKMVKTILDGRIIKSGYHKFPWNAINDSGKKVSAGIYIYRIIVNKGEFYSKKLIYIR